MQILLNQVVALKYVRCPKTRKIKLFINLIYSSIEIFTNNPTFWSYSTKVVMVKAVYQLLTEYVYCRVTKPDEVFASGKEGGF